MNHCLNGYWARSISYSLKITGIRTLKFLPAPFEKRNPEGLFFVDTFEKFVGSNFDRLLWRKKSGPPCSKTRNLYWGVGGGGGHKKWNVPWKRKRCLTNLALLFAEAVLEDVLGLGREKPVAESPLRNELVEVADPCTPTVPHVDVSSSKPSTNCTVDVLLVLKRTQLLFCECRDYVFSKLSLQFSIYPSFMQDDLRIMCMVGSCKTFCL